MSDLTTLLREHVALTEPALPPDPGPSLERGRRRLRVRRAVAATGAAVVVGAVAVAVPLARDAGSRAEDHGIDPVTQRALAEYDAQAMPGILEDHVSSVLSRHVDDLGTASFYAGDDQGTKLDPADYDRASGMSVTYVDGADHRWTIDLSHARSEAEGDARESCASDVAAHVYVSCDVTVTAAGDVVMSRLTALRPIGAVGGPSGWGVVGTDRLDTANPHGLWFARDVKVIHSETFVTHATEYVRAPDLETAESRFRTPVGDLVEIGTDPELVIPPPPGA